MIDFPTLSYIPQILKSLPPLIYLRPDKGTPLSGGALAQYHSGSTISYSTARCYTDWKYEANHINFQVKILQTHKLSSFLHFNKTIKVKKCASCRYVRVRGCQVHGPSCTMTYVPTYVTYVTVKQDVFKILLKMTLDMQQKTGEVSSFHSNFFQAKRCIQRVIVTSGSLSQVRHVTRLQCLHA